MIKETYANGTNKQYIRDVEGNIVKIIYPQKEGDEAVTEEAFYDAAGNLKELTSTLGGITAYSYQGTLLTSAIKPEGEEASLEYDKFGRLTALTDEKGGKISLTYDAAGRITTATDAAGNRESYTYDQYGQLIKATNPEGESSQLAYDSYGNLTKVTDARGNSIIYEYDKMGNRIKETAPEGQVTTYTYDKYNRITSMTKEAKDKENSQKICYTYKDLLVLPSATETSGQEENAGIIDSITDAEGNTYKIGYDKAGNVLTVTEEKEDGSKATIKRTYDKANRVTSYTDVEGNKISYAYNELGQLTTLTYPDGRKVTYTYDRNNNLTSVTDWEGRITNYTYNKNGQLSKLERADKTVETYEYDKAGQLTSQKDVDSKGKEIHSYDYTYNLAGNITKIEKANKKEDAADSSISTNKSSDASGEAEENTDTTVTMEYSDDNRLLSYNGEKVKYDEEGNMTYGPLDGKMTEFVYDCRNRLIKAGDTEYGYDAENNRVGVTKDGVTTKYVVDSNCEYSQVLTATTDDNVITYIYGDGLIAQESEQDYVTYHYNQVGSTTALTDEKGIVIETYEYSPYGDILDGDSSLTMFLYNGKYGVASDGNGLYYMRARYYDISIKRFVNQDVVIGHLDATSSLNRYAYCEGNPVSYLDPFGLDRLDTAALHNVITLVRFGAAAIGIWLIWQSCGALAIQTMEIYNAISNTLDILDTILYLYDFITARNESERKVAAINISVNLLESLVAVPDFTDLSYYFDDVAYKFVCKVSGNITSLGFLQYKNEIIEYISR